MTYLPILATYENIPSPPLPVIPGQFRYAEYFGYIKSEGSRCRTLWVPTASFTSGMRVPTCRFNSVRILFDALQTATCLIGGCKLNLARGYLPPVLQAEGGYLPLVLIASIYSSMHSKLLLALLVAANGVSLAARARYLPPASFDNYDRKVVTTASGILGRTRKIKFFN